MPGVECFEQMLGLSVRMALDGIQSEWFWTNQNGSGWYPIRMALDGIQSEWLWMVSNQNGCELYPIRMAVNCIQSEWL